MIRKWVKMLPYFIVMRLVRRLSRDIQKLGERYVAVWLIDEGEFLVYDEEKYKMLKEKEEKKQEKKLNKEFRKVSKILNENPELEDIVFEDIKMRKEECEDE